MIAQHLSKATSVLRVIESGLRREAVYRLDGLIWNTALLAYGAQLLGDLVEGDIAREGDGDISQEGIRILLRTSDAMVS